MTITVAKFVTDAIRKSSKTQKQIARETGFASSNIISMVKSSETKLPIWRVPALAAALEVSPQELLRICLYEYQPDLLEVLDEVLPGALLNEEELKFIAALRAVAAAK